MPWTVISRRANVRSNRAAISIMRNGHITWNAGTHEALGNPYHVELLFDAETSRIGLRKADESNQTFPVHKAGKQRTWSISAFGALKMIDRVPKNAYRRFAEEFSDGVWGIDIGEMLQDDTDMQA